MPTPRPAGLPRITATLGFALLILAAALPVAAQTPDRDDTATAQGEAGAAAQADDDPELAYETRIEGVPEDDLMELLRGSSQLIALQDRPPNTLTGLRRRAVDDLQRLRTALRSEGFYGAELDYEIDPEAEPVQVVVRIDTGPVYLLESAEIDYTQPIPAEVAVPRGPDDLDLHIGMRARAPEIVSAQRRIVTALKNNGFPEAKVVNRRAVVDPERTTLAVTWTVDPGPLVTFGEWRLEGLETVEADYVRRFRAWTPGSRYDQREVAETRSELMATGLFAGIEVARPEPSDGEQPIVFRFTERAHRSIGFTLRFSTSEGPSATAFWEHRNILGSQENLRLSLDVGALEQALAADFSKPRYLRPDQELNAAAEIARRETEAFDEEAASVQAELERDVFGDWRGALGGSLEFTRTEDNEGQRTFTLIGLPGRLSRDTRDDLLNPTDGALVELRSTPYFATIDRTEVFVRNSVLGTSYLNLLGDGRLILAGRGKLGSILGTETENIPASKRFFAGGGGSVRGFNFQEVGPLDADDDPLGGRSLLELSLELRWQVTDSIGIVPFLDAGNVYDEPLPFMSDNDDAELRYAAGLGLRYFTPIGPLRVDVARGLNRRDVDDAFELYISLGQAF